MFAAPLARLLVILGLSLTAVGGLVWLIDRMGISLERLPGDIRIQGENISCIFALGTSIFISILLTVGLNLIIRIVNR